VGKSGCFSFACHWAEENISAKTLSIEMLCRVRQISPLRCMYIPLSRIPLSRHSQSSTFQVFTIYCKLFWCAFAFYSITALYFRCLVCFAIMLLGISLAAYTFDLELCPIRQTILYQTYKWKRDRQRHNLELILPFNCRCEKIGSTTAVKTKSFFSNFGF